MTHNVPVQSLIDHIKTAIDVDPWAKEMVENLLREQPEIVRCKDCKHRLNGCCYNKASKRINFGVYVAYDWFCADGQKK